MTKLFIPYIMGNKSFIKNMKILDENGADIIAVSYTHLRAHET